MNLLKKIQQSLLPHPKDHVIIYATKAIIKRYSDDNLSQLGGQLAYFFILSLFPFLMLINQIISNLQIDILANSTQLQHVIPENILMILESYLEHLSQNQSTGLFTFSVLITIGLASKAITSLLYALNRAFRSEKKLTIAKRLISYLFIAITLVMIYLSIVFASIGKNLFEQLIHFFHMNEDWIFIWQYVRWLIPLGGIILALMALYNIITPKSFPIKYTLYGALFSLGLWQLMALGLSYYTTNFGRYSIVYGSLGAIMIMLLFLYWSGIIIVLGGELAHILAMRAEKRFEYDVPILPAHYNDPIVVPKDEAK